jgi:murein DD-endopeptidase MepM/ murein hydrolase activator NlpD
MPANRSIWRVAVAIAATAIALPAPVFAHRKASSGAAVAPDRPAASTLKCATGDLGTCPRGELLSIRGENLQSVDSVIFAGGRGAADNRSTPPRRRSPHRVLVQIPADASSGRVRLASRTAGIGMTRRPLQVVAGELDSTAAGDDGVFPVDGSYRFGTATNRFGGGRGHQGQDVFAGCGTPVLAALGGEVTLATYEARAGHYVVITADDGTSQAYMHMRRKPLVRQQQRVEPGAALGEVGQSGSAQGCHLHFELWTAPGWYRGGEPVDPLPSLTSWAAAD